MAQKTGRPFFHRRRRRVLHDCARADTARCSIRQLLAVMGAKLATSRERQRHRPPLLDRDTRRASAAVSSKERISKYELEIYTGRDLRVRAARRPDLLLGGSMLPPPRTVYHHHRCHRWNRNLHSTTRTQLLSRLCCLRG